MPTTFDARVLDYGLVKDLCTALIRGESAVVLGSPCCGTKLIADLVISHLKTLRSGPVVFVRLMPAPVITDENELAALIGAALSKAVGPTVSSGSPTLSGVFEELWRPDRPLPLLILRNIDSIPQPLGRRLLGLIRKHTQEKSVGVLLTGEFDLSELVHGPNSEFTCSHQVVLQGLGEDVFAAQAGELAARLGLSLAPGTCHEFFDFTGGNTSMMRIGLMSAAGGRACRNGGTPDELLFSSIREMFVDNGVLRENRVMFLGSAQRLIPAKPDTWKDIDRLLEHGEIPLKHSLTKPNALVLAGIVRQVKQRLVWASPLMKDLVTSHFSVTRRADLYASEGLWEEAFERYAKVPATLRIRPVNSEDLGHAERIANAFCLAIAAEASKGVAYLKDLVNRGCKLLLGFPEVWFWEPGGAWHSPDGSAVPEECRRLCERMELETPGRPHATLDLPEPWSRAGLGLVFPALSEKAFSVVLAGDFVGKEVIAIERRKLLAKILTAFGGAALHATGTRRMESRLERVTAEHEILEEILDSLGESILNPQGVLRAAAPGLHKLGYRRVLFCLVGPKEDTIVGELDSSDDPSVNIAEMTNYSLEVPETDIQQWVARHAEPMVIQNASEETLVNQTVRRTARLLSFAVIPVLNRQGKAVGTIHVERADGEVPTDEEIKDLIHFGKGLAVVLEQSERVNLLQSTLDRTPDPIVIVDALRRPRYANKPGAELLNLPLGFSHRGAYPPFEPLGEAGRCFQEALAGNRNIQHISGVGSNAGYRGAATADCILDATKSVAGAFVHIHDEHNLYRTFEALQCLARAEDRTSAMAAMLEIGRILGHSWGRLYLVSQDTPARLVGSRSYGFEHSSVQDEFERGEISLPTRAENPQSWRCIDERMPVVFMRSINEDDPEGDTFTKLGLQVRVTRDHCDPRLQKKPGDYWLDFPMLAGDRALGKITLQCNEDLSPERLELLTVLANLSAVLLNTILERDEWSQRAAQKSIAVVSHNIATRFSGLALLLSRYRLREPGNPDIAGLNRELAEAYKGIQSELSRAKEMFRAPTAHREMLDLPALAQECFRQWLLPRAFAIDFDPPLTPVSADPGLMTGLLSELMRNSLDVKPATELKVRLRIEFFDLASTRWVRLIYTDNGPGIPLHLKEKVFEDFYTYRPLGKSGQGLGLTYVRSAVTAHRGRIREDGAAGDGVRFVIEFPDQLISANETHS